MDMRVLMMQGSGRAEQFKRVGREWTVGPQRSRLIFLMTSRPKVIPLEFPTLLKEVTMIIP
jgi:hypothetical protein